MPIDFQPDEDVMPRPAPSAAPKIDFTPIPEMPDMSGVMATAQKNLAGAANDNEDEQLTADQKLNTAMGFSVADGIKGKNVDIPPAIRRHYLNSDSDNFGSFMQNALHSIVPLVSRIAHPIDSTVNTAEEIGSALKSSVKGGAALLLYPFLSSENQQELLNNGTFGGQLSDYKNPDAPTVAERVNRWLEVERSTVGTGMGALYPEAAFLAPVISPAIEETANIGKKIGVPNEWADMIPKGIGVAMDMLGGLGVHHAASELAKQDYARKTGPQFSSDTGPWANVPGADEAIKPAVSHVTGIPEDSVTPHIDNAISAGYKNQAPAKADFTATAAIMGADVKSLHNVYEKTGIKPDQVFTDAKNDPAIAEDIKNGQIPDAYNHLIAPETIEPPEKLDITRADTKDGFNVVDGQGDVVRAKFDSFDEAKEYIEDKKAEDELQKALDALDNKSEQPETEKPSQDEQKSELTPDQQRYQAKTDSERELLRSAKQAQLQDIEKQLKPYEDGTYADLSEDEIAHRDDLRRMVTRFKKGLQGYEAVDAMELPKVNLPELPAQTAGKYPFVENRTAEPVKTTAQKPTLKNPVLSFLKARGGIERGSNLAEEVKNLGNISPRFFAKKGTGLTDVDNIPLSEWQTHLGAGVDDGNGYVDRQHILDAIREELHGNPITKQGETEPELHEGFAGSHEDLEQYAHSIGYDDVSGKSTAKLLADVKAHEAMKEDIDSIGAREEARELADSVRDETEHERVEQQIDDFLKQHREIENEVTRASEAYARGIAGHGEDGGAASSESINDKTSNVGGTERGGLERSGAGTRESGAGYERPEHLVGAGEQAILPGAEKARESAMAQRGTEAAMKPKVAQKTANEGLFGEKEAEQGDLLAQKSEPKVSTEPKMPKDLAGAKPRYGYGQKQFTLDFDSDIDRALYIVGKDATKSKADPRYRQFLKDSGLSDSDIAARSQEIKDKIKAIAKDAEPGQLQVGKSGENVARTLSPESAMIESKFGKPESMTLPQIGKLIAKIDNIFANKGEYKSSDFTDEQFKAFEDYAKRVEDAKDALMSGKNVGAVDFGRRKAANERAGLEGENEPVEGLLQKPIAAMEKYVGKLTGGIFQKLGEGYIKTFQPELAGDKAKRADAYLAKYKAAKQEAENSFYKMSNNAIRGFDKMTDDQRMGWLYDHETGRWNESADPDHARFQSLLDATYGAEKESGASQAGYKDNYLPHEWENPDAVKAYFKSDAYIKKYGKDGFTKASAFKLIQDGVRAGFKLKTNNPERMLVSRLIAGHDMVATMDLLHDMESSGIATPAKAFTVEKRIAKAKEDLASTQKKYAELEQKVNDPKQKKFDFADPIVNNAMEKLKSRIDTLNSRVEDLGKEKESYKLTREQFKDLKDNGFKIIGPDSKVWNLHNQVGPLWKNAMDGKGLWENQGATGSAFRAYMQAKAIWVSNKLALSLFHPTHVVDIHLASGAATAAHHLIQGGKFSDLDFSKTSLRLGLGGKDTGVNPFARNKDATFGFGRDHPAVQAWNTPKESRTPEQQKIVTTMIEGGFKPTMSAQEAVHFRDNFDKAINGVGVNNLRLIGTAFQIAGGASAPLFQHWIPALKSEAYLYRADLALKRDPSLANDAGRRGEMLRQIAKDVDRNYGEMNHDVLFWNKTVRDAFNASMLSGGWKLAMLQNFRGLAEPFKVGYHFAKTGEFSKEQITHQMLQSYIYTAVMLMQGAAITYGITGSIQQATRAINWAFPNTGDKNPDGSEIHLNQPAFIKEAFMAIKDMNESGIFSGTGKFLYHQTLIPGIVDTLNNEDYVGRKIISDPTDLHQWMHAGWDSISPITLSSYEKADQKGSETAKNANILGFPIAGAYIDQTKFEQQVLHTYSEKNPPKDDVYSAYLKQQLKSAVAKGDTTKKKELEAEMKREGMTQTQIDNAKAKHETPFVNTAWAKLSTQDQKGLINSATDKEKKKFKIRE